MFCFPFRRKGRQGDPPEPPEPREAQPGLGELSVLCRHRRPGKGWARPWNRDGLRPCRESWRDTGNPGEAGAGREPGSLWNAGLQQEKVGIQHIREEPSVPCQARNGNVPGCSEVAGKAPELLEKLGTGRNGTGGKSQQEKLRENTPSGIQPLGKDVRDKPPVPRRARNGNVPREGMDQPQPPARAGSGEHEERESRGSSQNRELCVERDPDAATAPGRDPEPPSVAGTPGAEPEPEPREKLWEKLRQLGQDMEGWEGKSTTELAARLAELILKTSTKSYPVEPGFRRVRREQGSRASRDLRAPVGNDGNVLGMLRVSGNGQGRQEEEENAQGREEEEEEENAQGREEEEDLGLDEDEEEEEEQENLEEEDEDLDLEDEDEDQDQDQKPVLIAVCSVQAEAPSALAEEFPAVWARHPMDCGLLAEEELLDGPPVPFQPQHPKPPQEEREMAELLQEYLREGIVQEGTSDCNSPLIRIPKRHGRGWRLTLLCKALNKATPVGPQERLDRAEILASINPRSRYFSVLDLSNACLAIPLAPSCRSRFAFTFQGRQFVFARLPPTFHGTSSILHRRVAAMLARLQPGVAAGVFHYSDDILVTGKSRRQAEQRTRRVLELIQSTGFKAKRHKAQLVQRQVSYLGVNVGRAGLSVPGEKLREIRAECDAPGPWNARRLRSVLGKINAWRGFIADYSELVLPLQRLARPGKLARGGHWGPEQRWQLQRLLEALENAPVLQFRDKSRPFLIRLWPHTETVGAVLLQERAGTLLPVRFWSRSRGHRALSPRELRCLAALWALRAFRSLTGPGPIVIQDPSGRYLLRGQPLLPGGVWFSELQPELPELWTLLVVTKRPEPQEPQTIAVPAAPPLRQLPSHIPKANVWFLAVEKGSSRESPVGFAAANLEERWLLGESREGSDVELEVLLELLEQHRSPCPLFLYSSCPFLAARLENGEWEWERGWNYVANSSWEGWPSILDWLRTFPGMLRIREVGAAGGEEENLERAWMEKVSARVKAGAGKGCKIWEPSKYERQEIVAQCHSHHEDVIQTLLRVQRAKSWEDDYQEVIRWVLSCPTCRDDDPHDVKLAPQRAEGPWSCLQISLSQNLPSAAEGLSALLVVQDPLSGWLDAFPLQHRAEPDAARALLREVFRRFGKVGCVLLAPAPAWLWRSLRRAPLRRFWSRLERSEPFEAAEGLFRVVRAAGKAWAAELPLILAGIRCQWIWEGELGPLLCIPRLPLELRWELPAEELRDRNGTRKGKGKGNGNENENELSRLRRTLILPGYEHRVEAALQ